MSRWPVPVTCQEGVDGGAVLWRRAGTLYVTAVVKTTFALRHQAQAELAAPHPIAGVDEPHSELAPFLPQADVTLVGHAQAAGGKPMPLGIVRFALLRDEVPLFDRSVRVFGDRRGTGAPQPFVRMPLVYERAVGGREHPDNPVGLDARGEIRPNLVDPAAGARPAAFGPVAASWPARQRLLAGAALGLSGRILEVPEALSWEYFQVAPAVQRTAYLRGDEWIALEGVHADLASVQSRLPGIPCRAWLVRGRERESTPIELVADTLAVDADALTADLVWRGHLALAGPADLASIALVCALGTQIPAAVGAGTAENGPASRQSFAETAPLAQGAPLSAATPFRAGPSSAAAGTPRIAVSFGGVPVRHFGNETIAAVPAQNPALPASFSGAAAAAAPRSSTPRPAVVPVPPASARAGLPAPVTSSEAAPDPARAALSAKLRAAGAPSAEIDLLMAVLRFTADPGGTMLC